MCTTGMAALAAGSRETNMVTSGLGEVEECRVFGLHHVVLGFPKAESGKAGIERVVCGGKRAYLCDMYQWEIDVLVYDGFR